MNDSLRTKSEIHPLTACCFGGGEVVDPLVTTHAVPDIISSLVLKDIVGFDSNESYNVVGQYRQQDFISPVVIWLVVIAIDLRGEDVRSLH